MPKLSSSPQLSSYMPARSGTSPVNAKAWKAASSFESQALKSFLEQAYAGLGGDGPMGASGVGADAWRSMLIDEHAKLVTAKGGIGLAGAVYKEIAGKSAGVANARG